MGTQAAHDRIQELYQEAALAAADRGDQPAVNFWLRRMERADQITDVHIQLKELT